MYTIEEVNKIGIEVAGERNIKFKEQDLYYAEDCKTYVPEFHGLYGMFTEETQHTYGSKDELYFILGARKILKDHNIKISLPAFNAQVLLDDVKSYMKNIAESKGIKVTGDGFDDLDTIFDKSGNFDIGNYFWYYRNGKCDYLNILDIMQKNGLCEKNIKMISQEKFDQLETNYGCGYWMVCWEHACPCAIITEHKGLQESIYTSLLKEANDMAKLLEEEGMH